MKLMHNTIVEPLITEKSINEAKKGTYTFVVDRFADKYSIKHSIEKMFNVNVVAVKTNIIKGMSSKFTRKGKITTDLTFKKARVQVKKDQKIDIFDMDKK